MMSDKAPQPTDVLVHRLQRLARWLDQQEPKTPEMSARANVCWQAAARLEELQAASTTD